VRPLPRAKTSPNGARITVASVCWMTVQFSRSGKEGAGPGLGPSVSQNSTACRRLRDRRPVHPKAAPSAGARAPRPVRSTLGTCRGEHSRGIALVVSIRRSNPGAP
jgi:hypothetical protein